MKKDFSTVMVNLDGSPLQPHGEPLLLSRVAVDSLMNVPAGEKISGDESVRRYKLAVAIHGGGEVEVTAEDLVLIKRLIAATFGPLVTGQAFEYLEG